MADIGLFFGTDSGRTRKIAKLIAKKLGERAAPPLNVAKAQPEDLLRYPFLILGTPTYGMTYALSGYPVVEPERWDGDTRSWLYGTTEAASPVITAPDAAFLFQNAVA